MIQIFDPRLTRLEKAKVTMIDASWLVPAAIFAALGLSNSHEALFALGWWVLLFGAIPRAMARSRVEAPAKYSTR